MKKFFKFLVGCIVVVLILLVAFVVTLPYTISPIVKTAASVGGPKALGVPVSVGDVKLSPLAGSLVISQVKVGNPSGYSDKNAFAVDKVDIQLNIRSLLSDTIEVKKIQIDAPAISFETKDGKSNFDTMMANAQKSSNEEKEKTKASGEKKAGKKVVIDEFALNNAKVSYASGLTMGKSLTIPVPSVKLHDIGKKSGGTSFVDALSEVMSGILNGVTEAVTGAAGAAGDLLKGVGSKASSATKDAASEAVNAAENAAKSAGDAAKNIGGSLKKLFK